MRKADDFLEIDQALRLNELVHPEHEFYTNFVGLRGDFEENIVYKSLNVSTKEEPILINEGSLKALKKWFDEQEQADRKNARVADRVMIALPIELTPIEREKTVQSFLKELTDNQIPWFVAIHQTGADKQNPHAHILLRDKSILNGRRVVKTSEKGSTTFLREMWSKTANIALEEAGHEERIDHRSYQEQGIKDKIPTKHQGYEQKKWRWKFNNRKSYLSSFNQ